MALAKRPAEEVLIIGATLDASVGCPTDRPTREVRYSSSRQPFINRQRLASLAAMKHEGTGICPRDSKCYHGMGLTATSLGRFDQSNINVGQKET